MELKCGRRARGPMVVVCTLRNIRNSPQKLGFTSKEPMWTFDVNDVTQNNSYVFFSTVMGVSAMFL